MARMMMPSCYPKKNFHLQDSKMDVNGVFNDENDTPFSSVWTASEASEGSHCFHTPPGMRTPELKATKGEMKSYGKEGDVDGDVVYSTWKPTDTKRVVKPSAVHGEISDVTKTKLSDSDPKRFKLRIGPNYASNRRKAPSPPALYNLRAVDMITSNHKITHIARFFDRSKIPLNKEEDVMEGDIINGIPRFFVVTYMLPSYAPSMSLFKPVTDGHGFTVIFFFVLSKRGLEASIKKTGAYRVLRRFCSRDPDVTDKQRGPNLWKNVVSVANLKDVGLSFYLMKYINGYNAKPWLSRNADMFKFKGKDYYEVDLDIHVYNYLGLNVIYRLKPYLSKLVFDIGFTVQSEKDDEMPETLLGCGRLSHINYEKDCTVVLTYLLTSYVRADYIPQRKFREHKTARSID